ncbi:GlsB/YeaQ/YmgE family stress response membrane protein [Arthrobacter sp. NPDC090010]|uniref:GlsB/YeaQ/YmgE family stress response membrane protein n=1 Tax=Arthrobacter sp. NPDC090010 TaxID=3363942 RepID=UPI003821107A
MSFLAFLVLGLICGAIAKMIMPGEHGGGWITTLILGVVGAILGGWIGAVVFNVGMAGFWSLQSWILAIVGSAIVLFVFGLVSHGGHRRVSH